MHRAAYIVAVIVVLAIVVVAANASRKEPILKRSMATVGCPTQYDYPGGSCKPGYSLVQRVDATTEEKYCVCEPPKRPRLGAVGCECR